MMGNCSVLHASTATAPEFLPLPIVGVCLTLSLVLSTPSLAAR